MNLEGTNSAVVLKRPVPELPEDYTDLLDPWPQKCARVVAEIFSTEEKYITTLNDIVQGYRNPLTKYLKADSEVDSETDTRSHHDDVVSTIFCNMEEICNLHEKLLENLKYQQDSPKNFGQAFITLEEEFLAYTAYCINYDLALECLLQQTASEDMRTFLEQCQENVKHTLPLSQQLIRPVQRILKYHLMLEKVVANFDRGHPDYESLVQAHQAMCRVNKQINMEKKKKENAAKVVDIQNKTTGWNVTDLSVYGELILEAECKFGLRGVPRQMILLEKVLLFLKEEEGNYIYRHHILTSELQVDEKFSMNNFTMLHVSSLHNKHQSYVVDMKFARTQQEWLNALHAVINQSPKDAEDFVDSHPEPFPTNKQRFSSTVLQKAVQFIGGKRARRVLCDGDSPDEDGEHDDGVSRCFDYMLEEDSSDAEDEGGAEISDLWNVDFVVLDDDELELPAEAHAVPKEEESCEGTTTKYGDTGMDMSAFFSPANGTDSPVPTASAGSGPQVDADSAASQSHFGISNGALPLKEKPKSSANTAQRAAGFSQLVEFTRQLVLESSSSAIHCPGDTNKVPASNGVVNASGTGNDRVTFAAGTERSDTEKKHEVT